MPDFDPSLAKIRIGLEKVAPAIPAATIDRVTRFSSEELTDTFGVIEFPDSEVDGTTFEPASIAGPITAGPKALTLKLRASSAVLALEYDFFEHYANVATPAGATNTRDHLLAGDSTLANDFTSTVKGLSIELSRDDGFPRVITGARVQQVVYTIAGGAVVTAAYSLVWIDNTPFAAPAIVLDTVANTTQPVMVGILNSTNWDLADSDVYVKVDAVSGGPPPTSVDLLAKVGAAASYGTTTFTASNFGTDSRGDPHLTDVIDSTSGAQIGTFGLPVRMFIEQTDNYAATDEWRFDSDRAEWTPVFGAAPRFSTVDTCVTVGGTQEYPQDYTVTLTKPLGPPGSWVCGRRPPYTIRRGNIQTLVDFNREQRDREMVERIEYFRTAQMISTANSDTVIETVTGVDFNWRWKLTLPDIRPAAGQEVFTVTGAQNRAEATQFKGFAGSGPGGATAPVVAEWRNDIADPLA